MKIKKPRSEVGRGAHAPVKLFERILIAVDGSKSAVRAAKTAIELAKLEGAHLLVISVLRPLYDLVPVTGFGPAPTTIDRFYDRAAERAQECVDDVLSLARARGVRARGQVLKGTRSVTQSIVDYADNHRVNLTVIGRKGSSGFKRLLIGSLSSGVVSRSSHSVLVVR